MASKAAFKRLTKEYVAMQNDPPPFVWAAPDEKNILNWHYIIRGPPDCPFAGGEYYGVVMFPSEYPFKPPGIKMITPSGRFQPDKKICFSMSDFHPGSWNPAWSVATILTGLLSFMLSDEITTGSITTTDAIKRAYAAQSHAWNIKHQKFREAFPDYAGEIGKDVPNMAQKELGRRIEPAPSSASSTSTTTSGMSTPVSGTSTPATPTDQNRIARAQSDGALKKAADANASKGRGALSWGQVMWQKWYWGLLFAVAWAVSSRITGGGA